MRDAISLFTGAGALDVGLHAAGFRSRVAIDLDAQAVETLRHKKNARWWADSEIIRRPIEAVSSKEILHKSSLRVAEASLLVGGPPCQPFSKSGYWHSGEAKRLSDPRATTLREYLRVLEDTLPAAFLLENVPGLTFSQKDEGLNYLRASIERINARQGTSYSASAEKLNAVEFGVPQVRERVFVIGHREGKPFLFPSPTHTKPPPVDMSNGSAALIEEHRPAACLRPFTTAWDAIGALVRRPNEGLRLCGKWADLLPSIPEGYNYLYHTNRGGGVQLFGWRRRYWSMLLKLAKNRPSWTLTASPGPAIGPFHWENRRLSAEELAALQTLPPAYHVTGGVLAAHKQLGNAVPSALIELLALEIQKQFFGARRIRRTPSLVPCKRDDTPPPDLHFGVPEKYLPLVADYTDHPGEGLGPGATRRKLLASHHAALR